MAAKSMSPEDVAALVERVCGKVVAEKLETLQKTVTDHGSWINAAKGQNNGRIATATTNEMKGLLVGGLVGALAGSRGDVDKAVHFAKEQAKIGKDPMAGDLVKALEASTVSAGGVLIEEEVSSEFIDLLTPRAVVRSFGTTVLPMDSGGMRVPKLDAASTAYYIGEGRDAVKSQQSFGAKKLNARKLAVLIPVSNDLLRRGGPKVSQIIRNDSLRSAALKEDVSFIRSVGTEFSPKGLRYQAAADNILVADNSSYDLDSVTADLGNMILALEEANVAFSNPGWMFAPRTKQFLMTLRDGLGQWAFRAEMLTGKLWGWPFKSTTQIPRNLGSGSNESEIYLSDFDDVIIGDAMKLEVAVSTEASYKDENGDLVSAFSLDQTVMRMLLEHDIVLRHDPSVSVLTAVQWTPGGAA